DLAAYHEAHASRYVRPAKVTFTHHFFSTNRRESAFQDAQAALIQVSAGQDVASDSFIQHRDYVDRTHRQISEVFGSDFADQVLQAAPGQGDLDDPRPSWVGPFQSSYGYHLVALQGFDPGGRETFDEAYDRIVIDYETDLKSKAKDQFFETLLTEYDVVRE
ncbi:MAG: peptidylprolyl isomerase, partial [Pseudomonadota bacterium]